MRGLCPKTGRAPEMLSCIITSLRRRLRDDSLWSPLKALPWWQPPAQARAFHACPASQGTLTAFCRCWKAHNLMLTHGAVLPASACTSLSPLLPSVTLWQSSLRHHPSPGAQLSQPDPCLSTQCLPKPPFWKQHGKRCHSSKKTGTSSSGNINTGPG